MIHTSRWYPAPAEDGGIPGRHPPVGYAYAVVLVLVLMLGMCERAHADCSFNGNSSTGTYFVTLPTTITVDPNAVVGDTIYTSSPTGISPTVTFKCSGSGNAWGLQNIATANTPPKNVNLFESGVAGVGYRILQKGSYIYPYPYFSLDGSKSWQESDAVTIELVKTGTINNGSLLQTGQLARFQAGSSTGQITDAVIQITNTTTFVAPACTVTTKSITVTLPAVSNVNFSGVGSVAGTTPFAIGLTCSSGTTLRIQLDSPAAVAGKPGVIAPSSGGANGIGVQLLDSTGTAVNFGSAQTVGATPNGNLSVNYFARYFQTGTPVGAGAVQASATFTLSYQ
ncbi:fimbrial protein [Rhodanobacter ginsengisoli]|uniref:Fimbrial protein n=1 Tax=Rhodanobacter ginsengisoli TaxID=418646 RepID=A0ABW0QT47_9GAMM